MHVFIILSHPRGDSFNAGICRALIEGLEEAGHSWDLADLYQEGFNPCLGSDELPDLGYAPPTEDVRAYQERIQKAQALVFVFPVWWFGLPAILKGFIDRVFQENWAYRFTSSGVAKGLLRHEKALVISSAGASAALYKTFGFGKPIEKVLGRWTLKVCGIKEVKQVVFYDVVKTNAGTRRKYLEQARRLGRSYFGN